MQAAWKTVARTRVVAVVAAVTAVACGAKKDKDQGGARAPSDARPGAGPTLGASADGGATGAGGAGGGAAGDAGSARPERGTMPAAYRNALHEGRKLAGAKQWTEAAARFRAALAEVPEDPRALSELSWALFQARDPEARAVAERAVAAGRNNVKAASLYNLGRILEQAGDAAGAANAYRESLALRPNKTVAQHLAAVAPGEPVGVLEIEEWGPPLPTLPTTCAALGDDGEGFAEWSPDGACEAMAHDVPITGARGPFLALSRVVRKRSGSDEAFIAVRTADGWLLSPPFLSWGGVGTWGGSGDIQRAQVITHPTLGPVLRVDVKTGESGRWESWETEASVFCLPSRPGGSGALTCTPLLPLSWLHTGDDDEAVEESCSASAELAADGAVVVTAKTRKPPVDCPIRTGKLTWPPAR